MEVQDEPVDESNVWPRSLETVWSRSLKNTAERQENTLRPVREKTVTVRSWNAKNTTMHGFTAFNTSTDRHRIFLFIYSYLFIYIYIFFYIDLCLCRRMTASCCLHRDGHGGLTAPFVTQS